MRIRPIILAAGTAAGFVGCSATRPHAEMRIEPGEYAHAFESAKSALREFEFELDRVDARGGVITTAPRAWSGAATPWLPYSSTSRDPFEGFIQFEQRVVRVEFLPPSGTTPATATDLVGSGSALVGQIAVSVERFQRPGRRVDATSVRLASFQHDRLNQDSEIGAAFVVVQRQDDALAARIADRWNAIRAEAPRLTREPAAPSVP